MRAFPRKKNAAAATRRCTFGRRRVEIFSGSHKRAWHVAIKGGRAWCMYDVFEHGVAGKKTRTLKGVAHAVGHTLNVDNHDNVVRGPPRATTLHTPSLSI